MLLVPTIVSLAACGDGSSVSDDAGGGDAAGDTSPMDATPRDAGGDVGDASAPRDAAADSGADAGPPSGLCPSGMLPDGTPCPELAFPTAMGFGRVAQGGRGGDMLHVTSLNDSGEGTLRRALEESGPRIVVFDVAGTITLDGPIVIDEPFVTVAGQTAPGDGVIVRGAAIMVRTHEVIIRHLRVRPGDGSGETDAFSIYGYNDPEHRLQNIILDHVSVSWATDGLIDIWARQSDNGNITIQRSIVAETLHDSVHSEGTHSRAMLVGNGARRVSILHNLFAHNNRRHPHFSSGAEDVDVVNNVAYNYGQVGINFNSGDDTAPFTGINVVSNYFREGGDSTDDPLYKDWYFLVTPASTVHVSGNVVDRPGGVLPATEASDCYPDDSCSSAYRGPSCTDFCLSESPTRAIEGIEPVTAEAAWDGLLDGVGATVPARDAVDERVVRETTERTGSLVNCVQADGGSRCEANGGGWPTIDAATPPADDDGDGMPNAWETRHGLDPSDDADASERDLSAIYTNVEVYLNELAGDYDLGG